MRVHAVVVDHGLQEGSREVAEWAAGLCASMGAAQSGVVTVHVGSEGGPEAAARAARYDALRAAAKDSEALAVLLGHTREDQAETVLLRLARGSGARSLSGMRAVSGLWRRPLLDLSRAVVREAAADLLDGGRPWEDPHNDDPSFARVRVRRLLGSLADSLGAGAVLGLSRSAELLGDDADLLDQLAGESYDEAVLRENGEVSVDAAALLELPRAIRTRVIRLMIIRAGSDPEDVGFDHVRQLERFVTDWHGQGQWRLPGGVAAVRRYGRLVLTFTAGEE